MFVRSIEISEEVEELKKEAEEVKIGEKPSVKMSTGSVLSFSNKVS